MQIHWTHISEILLRERLPELFVQAFSCQRTNFPQASADCEQLPMDLHYHGDIMGHSMDMISLFKNMLRLSRIAVRCRIHGINFILWHDENIMKHETKPPKTTPLTERHLLRKFQWSGSCLLFLRLAICHLLTGDFGPAATNSDSCLQHMEIPLPPC